MSEKVDVRTVYLADHPAYAEEVGHLKYEQWLHTSPDRPYEVWIDEIKQSARKDAFPMTLIALQVSELVGFVTLIDIDERAGIKHGLWLITLYVKEAYRGQGIGAALLERCKAEVRQVGHTSLYLWTESAQLTAYYSRHGWRLIGQDEEGDDVMVCDLAPSHSSDDRLLVRPVEMRDAADLRDNCFSRNTVEEVQAQITGNVAMHAAQRGVQLVAEVDGVVIGTLTLIRNTHALHAHRADLYGIVVHPDYQRQGIARRMLVESGRYASALGIEILETSCREGTGAETAYARMGFVEYGRLPRGIVEPWDDHKVFDQVFYYLPLSELRE